MKKILYNSLLLLVASVLLWACEKDETKAVLREGVSPTLSASATNLNLKQDEAANKVVTFTWDAVDYGFTDAIDYVLQISKSGTSFASASTVEIGVTKAEMKKEFTVAELNAELNKILTPGQAQEVEVRLKANGVNSIVSNTIKMMVNPYRVRIFYNYPQAINVAGNFQGWSPSTAPQLVSLNNNNVYEGFLDFSNEATPMFKLVKGNDWSAGDFGASKTDPGKLAATESTDIKVTTGAGIYYVKADISKMEWSATKINSWGLIGDAIAGTGWDSDKDMTYDPVSKTWSITLDLIGDKHIKFRANDAWTVNLGDKGADFRPEIGVDDNIKVPSTGNYTITLDLLVGGNWIYMLKKN